MNNLKLRNIIIYSSTFSKILILLITISCIVFSAQVSVEIAASKWISHSKNATNSVVNELDFHPTQVLDIIARNGHSLPDYVKDELIELGFNFNEEIVRLNRPELNDVQYVDSGIFRFHYTLSGDHAVLPEDDDGNGIPDYVERMKQYFDDIAVIDFDQENYILPPSDDWYFNQENGGSGHFDVYLYAFNPDFYGFVQAENYAQNFSEITRGDNENSPDVSENNALVSWMAMRNNYADFPGIESNNVQVTSAHEFYHAIQYGYDAWERPWIKEASAVWMEEIHYPDINDCYQYLPLYFNSPELGPNIETKRMYGSYIYVLYLVDNHFDMNFMKSFWENSINHDSYELTDYSIITLKETMDQHNPNFTSEVFNDNQFEKITNDFLIANALVTNNDMYNSIYHYDEVIHEDWPITGPTYEQEIDSLGSEPTFIPYKLVGTFGAHYYKVNVSEATLVNISIELLPYYPEEGNLYLTIINNTDISTTHMNEPEQVVEDLLFTNEVVFFVSAFSYEFDDLFYGIRIVPNSPASTDMLAIETDDLYPADYHLKENFPNPFNPVTTFSYSVSIQSKISLEIFDIRGQQITQLTDRVHIPGEYSLEWDGMDKLGNKLESGIYIYTLNVNGQMIDSRKMVFLK